MRRGNEPAFVESENIPDEITGIYFGADFCAEHEWGIKDLREKLGIPEKNVDKGIMGFKACTVDPEAFSKNVEFATFSVNGVPHAVMQFHSWMTTETLNENSISSELHIFDQKFQKERLKRGLAKALEEAGEDPNKKAEANDHYVAEMDALKRKEGIAAAWSDRDFGVHVEGKDHVDALEKFYEAGCDGKIAVLICNPMPENPFSRGALTFMRMGVDVETDNEVDKALVKVETDARDLQKAFEKIGIEKRLKKAGLSWFALAPEWVNQEDHKEKAPDSKYPLKVWLNPTQQHLYNSRWCTIEELEEWIDNAGPIIKPEQDQEESDPGIFETKGEIEELDNTEFQEAIEADLERNERD